MPHITCVMSTILNTLKTHDLTECKWFISSIIAPITYIFFFIWFSPCLHLIFCYFFSYSLSLPALTLLSLSFQFKVEVSPFFSSISAVKLCISMYFITFFTHCYLHFILFPWKNSISKQFLTFFSCLTMCIYYCLPTARITDGLLPTIIRIVYYISHLLPYILNVC